MRETFWTLLCDPAHWEFELFLMVLFDGLLVGIFWPFVRKHWQHHLARDRAEAWAGDSGQLDPWTCSGCAGQKLVLYPVEICKGCGDVQIPQKTVNNPETLS